MARVLDTSETGPGITRLRIDAPRVAKHWRAGQFVIELHDEETGSEAEGGLLTVHEP